MDEQTDKVKVLLVDDEEEFLAVTSKVLGRRNMEVFVARNGEEALKTAKTLEVDVVVLDVKMPGMDGIEVFGQLKMEKPGLPVIMLTGHGTIAQALETSKEGVFDYLTKPCDPGVLAAKIHEAAEQARADKAKSDGEGDPGPDPGGPVQVLLVDDEKQFLDSFRKVLSRRGMEIHVAESGREALAYLKKHKIHVVVLDVKMPGMDGIEVLRRISKDHTDIEVILLTGHPTVDIAVQGIKLGAFEYVIKPPDVDALSNLIRKAHYKTVMQHHKDMLRKVLRRHPF